MVDPIADFRKELDLIDGDLFVLLKKRFAICEKIGNHKKSHGMPIENLEREKLMIEDKVKKSGLPGDFVEALYHLIFDESKRLQGVLKC
jgi:chorismate mutase